MRSKPIVLFVDDDHSVLDGIQLAHGRQFDVRPATSGSAGLEILRHEPEVAVIVCDLAMPLMDGATFLARACVIAPKAVRLLLTGTTDIEAAAKAVNEGHIYHFLTKPCPPKILESAVESALELHKGLTFECSSEASSVDSISDSRESPTRDDLKRLTPREREVLQLIAKGLRIADVAPLLNITPHTVCTHIKSIYRKRQVGSRAEAALEAQRLGLV